MVPRYLAPRRHFWHVDQVPTYDKQLIKRPRVREVCTQSWMHFERGLAEKGFPMADGDEPVTPTWAASGEEEIRAAARASSAGPGKGIEAVVEEAAPEDPEEAAPAGPEVEVEEDPRAADPGNRAPHTGQGRS